MSPVNKIIVDRYPGPKPYEEAEKDLFFGRFLEAEELFQSISVHNLYVIHSESGLGKSSLISAGLLPRLRNELYEPVVIRFKNRNTRPSATIIDAIIDAFKKKEGDDQVVNELLAVKQEGLWKVAKVINKYNKTLVLIFDQFEEFNYFPESVRIEAIKELAELVSIKIPHSIRKSYAMSGEDNVPESLYSQPEIKLVFSLRTDRIGILEDFVPYMPAMLRNRYILKPLHLDQGEQIVVLPAAMESTAEIEFTCLPFQYEPALIRGIVEVVKRKNNTLDTTQLQIICLEIQEKVRVRPASNGPVEVTLDELGGKQGLENLVKFFYDKQLQKIKNNDEISVQEYFAIRILLEKRLIVQKKRDRLSDGSMSQHFRNHEMPEERIRPLIDELLNLRLIRSIDMEDTTFYEIGHDTLIEPILKAMEERETSEKLEKQRKKVEEEKEKEREELRKQKLQWAQERELRRLAEEAGELARLQAEAAEIARELAKKEAEAARAANDKASTALAVAEAALKNNNELNKKLKRNGRFTLMLFAMIFFGLISYLLKTKKDNENQRKLFVDNSLFIASDAYERGDFAEAFRNLYSADSAGSRQAAVRIDTLIFPALAGRNILMSDDKSLCLVIGEANECVIWDIRSENVKSIGVIKNVKEAVVSPKNGYVVYSNINDSSLHIWDIGEQKDIKTVSAGVPEYKQNLSDIEDIKFSSGDRFCMIRSNGSTFIFSLAAGKIMAMSNWYGFDNSFDISSVVSFFEAASFKDVGFVPGDKFIYANNKTELITLGTPANYGPMVISEVEAFKFHPSLPYVAVLTRTRFKIYNYALRTNVFDVPIDYSYDRGFDQQGPDLFVQGYRSGFALHFDYNKMDTVRPADTSRGYATTLSEKYRIVEFDEPNTRVVYSFITRNRVAFPKNPFDSPLDIVVSDSAARLFYYGSDTTFYVLNASDLKVVDTFKLGDVGHFDVSKDGTKVYYQESFSTDLKELNIKTRKTTVIGSGIITCSVINNLLMIRYSSVKKLPEGTVTFQLPEALLFEGEQKRDYLKHVYFGKK